MLALDQRLAIYSERYWLSFNRLARS